MLFRIPVTASDGVRTTVTFQLDDHRKVALPYVFRELAFALRVEREALLDVLTEWSHDDLVKHLGGFTAAELRPPALRR